MSWLWKHRVQLQPPSGRLSHGLKSRKCPGTRLGKNITHFVFRLFSRFPLRLSPPPFTVTRRRPVPAHQSDEQYIVDAKRRGARALNCLRLDSCAPVIHHRPRACSHRIGIHNNILYYMIIWIMIIIIVIYLLRPSHNTTAAAAYPTAKTLHSHIVRYCVRYRTT